MKAKKNSPLTLKDFKIVMNEISNGPIPRDPITGRWQKRVSRKQKSENVLFCGLETVQAIEEAIKGFKTDEQ